MQGQKQEQIDKGKNRGLTELERRAYVLGHVIFEQDTKSLAVEHKRPEEFVACVLESALKDYQGLVEYLEKRLQERRKRSGRT